MYKLLIIFAAFCNVTSVKIIWDNTLTKNFDYYDEDNEVYDEDLEIRMPNWMFMYPGTKWCGPGNIASNYDDLGYNAHVDKCCRNHDHCDQVIEGYQSGYNLTNPAFYSRLSCTCDEEFYQCLKSVDKKSATAVGNLYFNAINTKCFKKEYPIIGCAKRKYFPISKCIKYILNDALEKEYQWFDVPIF